MIRTFTLAAICLALTAFGLGADTPSGNDEKPGDAAGASPNMNEVIVADENNGIRLIIRVQKNLPAGSPVPVRIRLVNDGKVPLWVGWQTQDPLPVRVEPTAKDGKVVPFTLYGQKVFRPTNLIDRANRLDGTYRAVKINPGDDYQGLSIPNLALFYDLTLSGEYALAVTKTVTVGEGPTAKEVRFKAEPIKFAIDNP